MRQSERDAIVGEVKAEMLSLAIFLRECLKDRHALLEGATAGELAGFPSDHIRSQRDVARSLLGESEGARLGIGALGRVYRDVRFCRAR